MTASLSTRPIMTQVRRACCARVDLVAYTQLPGGSSRDSCGTSEPPQARRRQHRDYLLDRLLPAESSRDGVWRGKGSPVELLQGALQGGRQARYPRLFLNDTAPT